MTREEAIKGLKSLVEVRRKYGVMQTMKDEIECLEMAIKALEQEPCEDCVSREAVIEQLNVYCKNNCKYTEAEQDVMCRACDTGSCIELIENTPSVTPARPKGKWEYVQYDRPSIGNYHCSLCRCIGEPTNFCPNCGAEMEVEE